MIRLLIFLTLLGCQDRLPTVREGDFARVSLAFHDMIEKCFPDLKGQTLTLTPYNGGDYFFETSVKPSSLFKERRIFEIYFNPRIFEKNISEKALKSILIHELNHIRDYANMSALELGQLAIKYLVSTEFRARYERSTDLKSLEMGAGDGLILYRQWLYSFLPAKIIEARRRNYWTPEEIEEWQTSHTPSSCL